VAWGENAGPVARVCRKLEGIPLAIELATARMAALAVEQVAQRLGVSLDVLRGVSRTATDRQRMLRATLDWSYELFSEAERALFRRLSIFAGGWTLEAAEAMCSGGGIEQNEVLDLLDGLVNKSLVVAGASTGGAVHYRMLEPIRQYAREKLEESREADEVRSAHAAFFLTLAEKAEPQLDGPDQRVWVERLEAEHDNLRTALSWALEQKMSELSLRLGGALWRFWVRSGHWSEGRRWLEEALATNSSVVPSVRANGLHGLGALAMMQDDYEQAVALYKESLTLYRDVGDAGGIATCLADLGEVASYQGDLHQAVDLLEEALARFRRLGNKTKIAYTLGNLAVMAIYEGNYRRASARIEESLELFREVGDIRGIAVGLSSLGWIALTEGNHERVTRLFKEAIARYREAGIPPPPDCLMNLGLAAMLRGDHGQATELIGEGLVLSRGLGDLLVVAWGVEYGAVVAASRSEAVRAGRLLGAAEALREAIGAPLSPDESAFYEPYITDARARLGEGGTWERAFAEGRTMTFEEAVEYALSEE
jgi:tetratricopeptide (TPR) repeat protein